MPCRMDLILPPSFCQIMASQFQDGRMMGAE
jgi:hypothetical protein